MTSYRRRQSYQLAELWAAMDAKTCILTRSARDGMVSLGFTEQDGEDCLRSLARKHFVKGEPDKGGERGVFHDQYSISWDGRHVFIKFYRVAEGQPFFVTSFKADTDFDF